MAINIKIDYLPLETRTLYAELMEQISALEAHRSIGRAPGCFTEKKIKGVEYYYFQYSEPGKSHRQIYVGKKTPFLEKVVNRFIAERETFKEDMESIHRLCSQLRIGGAHVMDVQSARVLRAFADSGIFHLDGVLIGTNAFAAIGNLLGVRWGTSVKTEDIDISGQEQLDIALSPVKADIPSILEGLEMGFLPVPSFNRKAPSTSFKVRGKALRVDILTPARKGPSEAPVYLSRFNVAAQPLKFLDFLMDNPERAAIINGGGVLVNVPAPARFAFHKLILSLERPVSTHGKAEKDLTQSAQLISVLANERPGDLLIAWDEIKRRGSGWVKRVAGGFAAMEKMYPEAAEKLGHIISDSSLMSRG